ncbi:MAG TPA: nucleotidyltransferase domain-containing protein, partial [Candidatus Cloacimonetes bacterium]|nr:nucleotidyltransferase domain-containing protein [Candidatus Cloacimonadota bacterium]
MKINRKKLEKEAEKLGIKMIVLFGSQAEGKARPDSDYDVAVLTTPERNIKNSMKICTDILFFLSDALDIPDQKLDLTNLNNA